MTAHKTVYAVSDTT